MIALTGTLAVLLGLCTCLFGLRGLARLRDLHLRGGVLALGACAAQLVGAFSEQRLAGVVCSAALLLSFCALNRRHAGMLLIGLGLGLNMLVMGANGGAMPLEPAAWSAMGQQGQAPGEYLAGNKSQLLTDERAALPWLGDRLLLPGPLRNVAAWSIGDVLLIAGVGRLLWSTMKEQSYAYGHTLQRR